MIFQHRLSMNFKIFTALLLLMLLSNASLYSQQITLDRVEPPFWWVGMKNENLQLLVYGKSISLTKPEIITPGLSIVKVTKAESPNYLFVDLVVSSGATPGIYTLLFKKDGQTVQTFDYELKARRAGSVNRKGFDQSDVIYLLFPDRFANGNPGNDSHPEMLDKADRTNPDGRQGGDIQGMINKIDYISDLGFTSIWHNPLLENNQAKYSYHGYAISNFYRIDPRFGTNDDYLRFIQLSHDKGLKVIKDMIFNHCGSGHWWMNDLPWQDWINQFESYTRSNFRAGTVFDPYVSEYDQNLFQRGWFDTNMPDLNQNNPFMINYLTQNSIWWVEYADLDGIRMDTYPYPFKEGMAQWAKRLMDEYPDFTVVAESWLTEPGQVATWQRGDKLGLGYESHVTHVFDFPMYEAFRFAFNEQQGWNSGLVRFYNILSQDYLYQNPSEIVIFSDNHDGDRIFNKVNKDMRSLKLAMTFLLTTRGVPQIYNGTEIMMAGDEKVGHGDVRKPFPGGWPDDNRDAFTRDGRTEQENEIFDHIHTLLKWRKSKSVIHYGRLTHFIPHNNTYIYFRYNETEKVMVILNNSDEEQKIDIRQFAELAGGNSVGVNILDNTTYQLNNLKVPAKTGFILELK